MAKRHKHKNRKQKQTAKDQPERIVVQDLDAFEVGEDLDDQSSVEPSKEILKQPQKAAQKQGAKRANDAKLTKTEVQETQPRETKGERAEEAVHNDARVEAAPRRQHTMPVAFRVLFSVVFLAAMSVLFTWFILWRQNLCDAEDTGIFIGEKPVVFAYSCLVVFCLMAVLASLTWRTFFSVGLSFALMSILTYIHMQKYQFRATPLLPEDFQLADSVGNLVQFVDVWGIVRLAVGVIFVLFGSALLEYYTRKVIGRPKKELTWWERTSLIPRTTFTLISLVLLTLIAKPVLSQENYDWIDGLELVAWNQTDNYEDNGFVVGFLYNLGRLEIPEPENYSEETMRQIAEKYRAIKAADTGRKPMEDVAKNVIVILDETFYDPELLDKYYAHTGGVVLPNIYRIFRNYPSGYMYSPEYGGNTANVEFEVQTGLSNFWASTFPYVGAVSKLNNLLSIASWTKEFGFKTTAIHSYDGSVYKRDIVYPKLGYDAFIDEDEMTHKEYEGESIYINNKSIFTEILDVIKSGDGELQMIGAATMQNHGPYDGARYPHYDFSTGDSSLFLLEANFQSLNQGDAYLAEFLEEIDALDEPTVVLWFGDHAAGLLDRYINSDDKEDQDLAHITPYFIYANFEIESEYTVAEVAAMNAELGFSFPTRGVDLPTTTPNCLQNTMYNLLGVEKPALFYLLDTVCVETPVLSAAYYGNKTPKQTSALQDYELVNYDVLGGKHYWDGN